MRTYLKILVMVIGLVVAVIGLLTAWIQFTKETLPPPTPVILIVTATVQQSVAQPTATVQQIIQQSTSQPVPPSTAVLSTGKIPGTPDEAAALFGGPPANQWAPCPEESGCWMFALPGSSYTVSVPENCINVDGSIHGWRRNGGYPEEPDSVQGTRRIWNDLEAATIRCR